MARNDLIRRLAALETTAGPNHELRRIRAMSDAELAAAIEAFRLGDNRTEDEVRADALREGMSPAAVEELILFRRVDREI